MLNSRLQNPYTEASLPFLCVLQRYFMDIQTRKCIYTSHSFLSSNDGILYSFAPHFLPISWQAIYIETCRSALILFNGYIKFHYRNVL